MLTYDSLLAIDVGEITTRAMLFDVVDERYRFVAVGSAPTTLGQPFRNAAEGVRMAIDSLEMITGRKFVGRDENLIIPSAADGSGVDTAVVVMSAGAPLRVIVVGLLDDISVESARRLASTTYTQIVDTFSLNDRRKLETQLDAVLRLKPDLVLVAGGTEGGAKSSVLKLIEPIRLACNLLPDELRPQVLYAGNQELGRRISGVLSEITTVDLVPNVRPTLEMERMDPAQNQITGVFRRIRIQKVPGMHELDTWAGGGLLPRASAFGRMVRFLGLEDESKGVLGVDVGISATTLAAAFSEELIVRAYSDLGLGRAAFDVGQSRQLGKVAQWLSMDVGENYLRDYLANKHLYPSSIPATPEDLAIEQALARYVLRQAVLRTLPGMRAFARYSQSDQLIPPCEPIIASGGTLTAAPQIAQTMLMLLDGIQPTGITTVILDRNNLLPVLGAAAGVNPTLAVQVLDTGTFLNLGTVISPVSTARTGTPILRVEVGFKDSNEEAKLDVKQGSLEVIPLTAGQVASIKLRPLNRADIGMGAGRGGSLKRVVGGAIGLVIDARGRPVRLSDDPDRRQELFKKWLWTLGN